MEGIPESVSVVILIIPTILFPRLAYSTRYIAEKIPSGTDIRSAKAVVIKVFIRAGVREQFSEL